MTAGITLLGCVSGGFASAEDLGPIQIVAPVENSDSPFQLGDVPQGEFTGVYDVIEREELQQQGASLAEIVAQSAGVQFKQSGGVGSFSTVSLRGSTAEQVNVYLDGVLLNEAAGGGVNLSHIELMQADRVEVYRGAVPAQLGNSAIGGAVNITSNRATARPSTRLLAGFGSFGSTKFSASYAGPVALIDERLLDQQRLVASFTHRKSDNNFGFINDNGTELNSDDDTEQKRNNAAVESTSGFLKAGFAIDANSRFEQALQIDRHIQGVADWRNSEQGNAALETDSMQWRAAFTRQGGPGVWGAKWGMHYGLKEELFDDRRGSVGLGLQRTVSDTRVLGGSGYLEKVEEGRSLSLSVKGRYETLDTQNLLRSNTLTTAQRTRADVNLQWNRFYAGGDSLLSVGFFGFVVNDEYDNADTTVDRDRYSTQSLLPKIGVNHNLGSMAGGTAKLIGNASLQKRVPSFFELFGSQGFFEGNPALSTETSRNVDVGVEWMSDASASLDTTIQLVWFYHRKEDLISRVYDARGVGRSENISAAIGSGLEFNSVTGFGNGFEIDTSLTLQDSENRSQIRGFRGKQLPGEAAIDGALSLRWKNPRWKIEYSFRLNEDRYYDSANLLRAADQKIHSASLDRYFRHWRLSFELNNIGNHNYEDFNGYPKPGRSGFVSVTYQP